MNSTGGSKDGQSSYLIKCSLYWNDCQICNSTGMHRHGIIAQACTGMGFGVIFSREEPIVHFSRIDKKDFCRGGQK